MITYLADRVLSGISAGHIRVRDYLLVIQPLPRRAKPSGKFVIREFRREDIPQAPVPAPVIEKRLANEALGLVIESNGEFAGYAWFQAAYDEDEVRCRFEPGPGMVWDYDIYIVPRFRCTRAFLRLWEAAGEKLTGMGYTHSASRITAWNEASLRAHAGLGGKVVGRALFVVVGPCQLMLSGWRAALTWSRAPVIRLPPMASPRGFEPLLPP